MKPFQDLTWFQSIGATIDLTDIMQRGTAALLEKVFECSDILARNGRGRERWCISRMSHESLACLDNRGSSERARKRERKRNKMVRDTKTTGIWAAMGFRSC